MELPITPKFFKKVELFQEFSRLDKRYKERDVWKLEKDHLKWAHRGHFHLGTFLDAHNIMKKLQEDNEYKTFVLSQETSNMMENLVEHGWADSHMPHSNEIKINSAGMLMAEVVSELDNPSKKFYYLFIIWFSWVLIGFGSLVLLIQSVKYLIEFFIKKI